MSEKHEELELKEKGGNKAILGTLEGPCADFQNATRNGRKYSESLWEKVFNDPIITEMIECGGIPGELDHPTDREEIDSSRIAVMLREKPKKKNGKLWAKFDILDTPLGNIAYTLAKAGFKLGISSRGSGDTYTDYDGSETVDESTYDFKCFDLVLLPAVKDARLNLVTESFNKKFNYKTALQESLNKASNEDRKLMEEVLDNLNIDLGNSKEDILLNAIKTAKSTKELQVLDVELNNLETERKDELQQAILTKYAELNDEEPIEESLNEEADNKLDPKQVAVDWINEDTRVLDALAELLVNNEIKTLDDLTNFIDNCTTVDAEADLENADEYEEIEDAVDDANSNEVESSVYSELEEALANNSKLESQVLNLQEKLSASYAKEAKLTESISSKTVVIERLAKQSEVLKTMTEKANTLAEENNKYKQLAENKSNKVNELENKTLILKEKYDRISKDLKALKEEYNNLQENYKTSGENEQNLKTQLDEQKASYGLKLANANKLVEQYKGVATKAVDRYIDSQAVKLGVKASEIKEKLPESYNFHDIDEACKDMQRYQLNIGKLPFMNNNISISSSKNREPIVESISQSKKFSDDIDDSLLELAGLK